MAYDHLHFFSTRSCPHRLVHYTTMQQIYSAMGVHPLAYQVYCNIIFYTYPLTSSSSAYTNITYFFIHSGVGITGGVHRLWAHRSYKATYPLRLYLMLSNSIANQGSIWHWARDHRVHHKHSEVIKIRYLTYLKQHIKPYEL